MAVGAAWLDTLILAVSVVVVAFTTGVAVVVPDCPVTVVLAVVVVAVDGREIGAGSFGRVDAEINLPRYNIKISRTRISNWGLIGDKTKFRRPLWEIRPHTLHTIPYHLKE